MKDYDELIWKRIHRNGKICSQDLEKMLGVTNVHASRLIKIFLEKYAEKVYKKGRFLVIFPQEKAPNSVINNSLINQISVAVNQPMVTGLFDSELPIVESSISYHKKLDDFLITILKAIKISKAIEVVYVSLTYKNSPDEKDKPRTIYPLSFKFFDGFWYLIAVDLGKDKSEIIKMFSLNRFQYVQISEEKFKPKNTDEKKKLRFLLTFNSAFTQEQKNIIIDELGLKLSNNIQYYVDIFEYERFSFKRKYLSEEKPTHDSKSIYPFFTSYSEVSI